LPKALTAIDRDTFLATHGWDILTQQITKRKPWLPAKRRGTRLCGPQQHQNCKSLPFNQVSYT
jgi:hypothetical protein